MSGTILLLNLNVINRKCQYDTEHFCLLMNEEQLREMPVEWFELGS